MVAERNNGDEGEEAEEVVAALTSDVGASCQTTGTFPAMLEGSTPPQAPAPPPLLAKAADWPSRDWAESITPALPGPKSAPLKAPPEPERLGVLGGALSLKAPPEPERLGVLGGAISLGVGRPPLSTRPVPWGDGGAVPGGRGGRS